MCMLILFTLYFVLDVEQIDTTKIWNFKYFTHIIIEIFIAFLYVYLYNLLRVSWLFCCARSLLRFLFSLLLTHSLFLSFCSWFYLFILLFVQINIHLFADKLCLSRWYFNYICIFYFILYHHIYIYYILFYFIFYHLNFVFLNCH